MLNASANPSTAEPAAAADTPRPHVSDFIAVIARLAQTLSEESEALDRMQIRKVSDLQEEKLRLTSMLEKFRKYYDRFPGELEAVAAADKEDLESVMTVFNGILQKNYRRLLVARELNHKMVEAIRDAVKEASTNKLYNTKGSPEYAARENLSITLNQII